MGVPYTIIATGSGTPTSPILGRPEYDLTNHILYVGNATPALEAVGGSGAFLPLAGGTLMGDLNLGVHNLSFGRLTSASSPDNPAIFRSASSASAYDFPFFNFQRARGTLTALADVVAGDVLGAVTFYGALFGGSGFGPAEIG